MKQALYDVILPSDTPDSEPRVIRFRELQVSELDEIARVAGGDSTAASRDQLERTIIRDGPEELTYGDLAGNLQSRFTMREFMLLLNAWESVHSPTAEELDSVKAVRVV